MRQSNRILVAVCLFASLAAAGSYTYTLEKSANPSAAQLEAYARIHKAMDTAVGYYNTYTGIRKHISVQYDPGITIPEGTIGDIRFGTARDYVAGYVAMYLMAHSVGVGTTPQFAAYVSNGRFNGPLATAALRRIGGNDTAHLYSDGKNFWPYGLNYANEVKSTADLVNHCKIIDALHKDLFHESIHLEGRIRNVSTKQCISLSGSALAMGSCADSASFVRIVAMGDTNPVYRLELGNLVLDAPNQSAQAGLAMGAWTWTERTNQKFKLEASPLSDGRASRLKLVHSDLYLHPSGTALVQDAATTGPDFDWELIKGSVPATITRRAVHGPAAVPQSGRLRMDALGRRFSGTRNRLPFAATAILPSP